MNQPCLIVFLLFCVSRIFAAESLPNIVLILADDLGYGDIGCYNPEAKVATPHLDALAKSGLKFNDAHSPSTVCTPTRYSLLTGRMAFRNGMRGVFDGVGGPCLIEKERLTLGGMLQDSGYDTALYGKWHIGLTFYDAEGQPICKNGLKAVQQVDFSRPITDGPIHRGFDRFFGTASCPTTDWLYAWIDGDRVPVPPTHQIDKVVAKIPVHPYSVDCRPGMIAPDFDLEEVDLIFLEKTLAFLDSQQPKDKPFFLFHSMQAVHLPSLAAKQFQGKSGAGPHGDFIVEMDYVVGEIVRKVDSLGLGDNTLIVFTSDNGPETASVVNMRADHDHDGARPWRGIKRDQWEGGHRVPTIVRWPSKIEAGRETDHTVCMTDLMATCAEIVGVNLPNNAAEDSASFLPILLDDAAGATREFTLHQTISLALAIRQGDWKYLDHKGSGGNRYEKNSGLKPFIIPDTAPDTPGQLYNLKDDPGETLNLVAKHPEIAARLKAKLDEMVESGRSVPAR